MFRKKSAVPNTIECLIGASTRVEGNVVFHGGLRVDGHVRGDVIAGGDKPGMLVIGENARIEGDVEAAHLIVNGSIEGSIAVTGPVELQSKARISGELRYRTLEVQSGAVIEGLLSQIDSEGLRPGLKLASSKEATFGVGKAVVPRIGPNTGQGASSG